MSFLLDLFYPRICSGCGVIGSYLCIKCQNKLIFKSITSDNHLSFFRYHGAIKQLITDLKFSFVSDCASSISDLICWSLVNRYPHLLRFWQNNNFTLIPIPLHPSRFNWRGFNQSELICQKLSAELNLKFNSDILIRSKYTSPQTSIYDRRLRRSNTQSSFLFRSDFLNSVKFLNFIIFDDVYTTGSTINSAKTAFPKDSNIWTLTLAG